MKIGIFHGYEMQGSGSNEYVRYLSRALAEAGHEVHVLCRDGKAAAVPHVSRVFEWSTEATAELTTEKKEDDSPSVTVHVLPHASVRPVFITDKARKGNVKAFKDMTDEELAEYHELGVRVVGAVLDANPVDIFFTNHVVYQPVIAAEACPPRGIPFIIFPHGSAIEYTVRGNDKFLGLVRGALVKCDQLISGSKEVRDRILGFYPDIREEILAKTQIVGVGVDTALFRPVARDERGASIDALVAEYARMQEEAGTTGSTDPAVIGKTPELVAELQARLDSGDIDAVKGYVKTHYNHGAPDSDLVEKLRSINWDAPVLFFVGAMTAGKGVQSLLVALPRLFKTHPDVQAILVGAGAYREGLEAFQHAMATGNRELLMALVEKGFDLDSSPKSGPFPDIVKFFEDDAAVEEALAVGNKIKTNVKILGRMNHDLLRFLFPCVDVATFPSVVPEAYPLVLMESLSNGVLPLVSNFSGFKDGLDELEQWLGPEWVSQLRIHNDPTVRVSEIASNLASVISSEELKTLGPRLRDIATEHYDWSVRAGQIAAALEATLASKK